MNDVIGFTAAIGAGLYAGYFGKSQGTLNLWPDWAIIVGLLAVAFYFAVILS